VLHHNKKQQMSADNFWEKKINIGLQVQVGGLVPGQTGRLTVGLKITLVLTYGVFVA
jgi:hypothetical protein